MRYSVLLFHPYAFLHPSKFTKVFPIQYIPDNYNSQGKLSFKLKTKEGRVRSMESDIGPFVPGKAGLFGEGKHWIYS